MLPILAYGQDKCNELIETEKSKYIGCLNYEGLPDGNGLLEVLGDGQTQTLEGTFKNGEFDRGKHLINFESGNRQEIIYENYAEEIIAKEIYYWISGATEVTTYINGLKENELYHSDNGDEILTEFKFGIKEKEVRRFSDETKRGLILQKIFNADGSVTETSNIENNRVPDDIFGDRDYIEVDLIEQNNQYRINVDFVTLNGGVVSVPIQFDSGASAGLFIGNRLYNTLLEKCEIVDLNVRSKSGGVGSEFSTKYIKIKALRIGDYLVKNVVAIVPDREDINDLLIGVGFLKKFKEVEWSMNSNTLKFYK